MSTPTDSASAPQAGSRKVAAARALGRHAALTGEPLGSCPFNTEDGGEELVLALNWRRAYRAVAPPETDYSG